jgi:hypothetical protein
MTFDEFLLTTEQADGYPAHLSLPLQALWYDKRNDWQHAHSLLGDAADIESAWVHAYLHRKEGDWENARYWYKRANQPVCLAELDQEWQQIAQTLLEQG